MLTNRLSKFHKDKYIFMLINLFLLFFMLFGQVCYSADEQKYLDPALFLNDYPEDIHVVQGQPVTIPIFLVSGDYTSIPLEFFVWRQELDTNRILCLVASGWQEVNSVDVCQPLAIFQTLPSYYRLAWEAFDGFDSSTLNDFSLTLCLDPTINYHPEEDQSAMFCAARKVIIDDPAPAPDVEDDNLGTSQSSQETDAPAPDSDSGNITPPSSSTGPPSFSNIFGGSGSSSVGSSNDSWDIYGGGSTQHYSSSCESTSVNASPSELSFYAYVGETSTGTQTIRIRDNCGHAVAAHVTSVPDNVTVSPDSSTSGQFSVQVSLSGLDGVTELGNIRIMPDSGDLSFSIPVKVTITDVPNVSDEDIPTLREGYNYYTVGARSFLVFKVLAGGDGVTDIQFGNTPYADQPRTVHMLVKRGSVPTVNEFNETWKIGRANGPTLYYKYNIGSQAEFVEIMDGLDTPQWYYVMLYNNGDRTVIQERLSLKLMY